jgi:hypothetical protein
MTKGQNLKHALTLTNNNGTCFARIHVVLNVRAQARASSHVGCSNLFGSVILLKGISPNGNLRRVRLH